MAGILERQGHFSNAREKYAEASEVGADLMKSSKIDFSDLSVAWTNEADLLKLLMEIPNMPNLASFAEGDVKQVRTEMSAHPDFAWLGSPLGESLEDLGQIQFNGGDFHSALASYQEALAAERLMLIKLPTMTAAKAEVADILEKIAQVQHNQGDLNGAAHSLQEGLDTLHELSRDDVANGLRLTTSNAELSEVRLALGDVEGADRANAEALRAGRALVLRDPQTLVNEIALSAALRAKAMIDAQRGDRTKALAELNDAQALIGAGSVEQIHELFEIGRDMALLGSDELGWRQLVELFNAAQKSGKLAKSDYWMIDDAQRHLTAGPPH